jgi:serine/threonine protein phosphatase PrpC
MRLTYAGLSEMGPVRKNNEDFLGFAPPVEGDKDHKGYCVIIADGVGGHGYGEVASRMATETACKVFDAASPDDAAAITVRRMFDQANLAVYDAGMDQKGSEGKMATTFTVALFRSNQLTIGHVGDTRAYALHEGRLTRLTNDHSYAGVQVKLGLITVDEVNASPLRSVLTRTVGQDPAVHVDFSSTTVAPGDLVVMCTDGVHAFVAEREIGEMVRRHQPEQACRELIDLAVRRGSDDNMSIQVVRVDAVETVSYYRGLPVYQDVKEQPVNSELQVGQLLDERFEITDVISRSGMATVFKATDRETGGLVAIKAPFMQFESDPAFFTRFQREEEIGGRLQHPYILRIVKVPDEKKSRMYLVMEYLEGQTLGHLMRSVKPMPVNDSLKLASRICEALAFMHDHDVVHRDLKPDNVMICNDGSIRIMDFGIAKMEGQRRLTFGGFQPTMGTPDYMAPEQVKGKRGDPRTDIYSLGAILYEMITGAVPFEGPNAFVVMNARLSGDPKAPRKINPQISPEVEEIVLHAMARVPSERYASASQFKAELDNPQAAEVTGRAERLQAPTLAGSRWSGYRMTILAIAIPILLCLLFWLFTRFFNITPK